jgi:hypothetical protein
VQKQLLAQPFTELKNKAVKRYYLVDARNKVEAAINSLPSSDEPDASARFGKSSACWHLQSVTWATNCTISTASPWTT